MQIVQASPTRKPDAVHWDMPAKLRPVLLDNGMLRLDEWLRTGQATLVKQQPQRLVYRVVLPEIDFHLKINRVVNARALLRQVVRPSKARMEHDRAVELARRNIPTFAPIALGELRHGPFLTDSILLTRTLTDVVALGDFIEHQLPSHPHRAVLAQRLAEALGDMLARMHEGGVTHQDLHAGNFLVSIIGQQVRLFLVDLHTVKLGKPLDWNASRDNLVMLNRWFLMRVSRSDRLRFWRSYSRARWPWSLHDRADTNRVYPRCRAALEDMALDLEERTWESNLAFWKNRDGRCLVNNRYYQKVGNGRVRGHILRGFDAQLLDDVLADPDALFCRPDARVLKDSRSSTVVELTVPHDGRMVPVILKRFRITQWHDSWINAVRRSPALRSWVMGHGLRERCLPTAKPLIVLHRCRHGLKKEGYLMTEKIANVRELNAFVNELQEMPAGDRRTILDRVVNDTAWLIRELHQRKLSHRDLKAANILIDKDLKLWFVDLVGVEQHADLSRRIRMKNLARLNVSFASHPLITRTVKLRFLRKYLQWNLVGKEGWKRWWLGIAQATQEKLDKNRRQGRMVA